MTQHRERPSASGRPGKPRTARPDKRTERAANKAAPAPKPAEPEVDLSELDSATRSDLKVLPKELATWVGTQLVLAAHALDDDDPEQALIHARAARTRASRLAVVREAAGVVAYQVGEWQEALSELRAARRMSGSDAILPMLIDCERALGRPEKAQTLLDEALDRSLDVGVRAELTMIVADMRRTDGDLDGAAELLRDAGIADDGDAIWLVRLRYAYADVRAEQGDTTQAREWFTRAAEIDSKGVTDAAARLFEMDGFVMTEDSVSEGSAPEDNVSEEDIAEEAPVAEADPA